MVNFKPLEYIRKMSDIDTSGFQEKKPSAPNRSYDPQLRMNDREGKKLLSKSILYSILGVDVRNTPFVRHL